MSQLWCAVWGHEVDNHRFLEEAGKERRCRCGTSYLDKDGSLTHVRHTLSCFLGHHTYQKLIERDEHTEYVCVQCGHPLLFRAEEDPYRESVLFNKKVRYLCGLFGHDVHVVADRHGYREFACHCGHTFLKAERDVTHITHPAICVVSGHRIRYVATRGGYLEYVCRDCGHPFCFAEAARA
jgi:DNA-directed RNA polymerase subunit RPC12/RpoP